MVFIGLRCRGKGAIRFAPDGAEVNASEYIEIVKNTYLPDCHQLYGVPPTFVFQKDGASSHTSNATQVYLAPKSPRIWLGGELPPNSPDLGPLDYFA